MLAHWCGRPSGRTQRSAAARTRPPSLRSTPGSQQEGRRNHWHRSADRLCTRLLMQPRELEVTFQQARQTLQCRHVLRRGARCRVGQGEHRACSLATTMSQMAPRQSAVSERCRWSCAFSSLHAPHDISAPQAQRCCLHSTVLISDDIGQREQCLPKKHGYLCQMEEGNARPRKDCSWTGGSLRHQSAFRHCRMIRLQGCLTRCSPLQQMLPHGLRATPRLGRSSARRTRCGSPATR